MMMMMAAPVMLVFTEGTWEADYRDQFILET